jgi:hypothetical protein
MKMNKTVVSNEYDSYILPKTDRKTGLPAVFYTAYLDKLILLVETACLTMYKPHVMHLRLKLQDGIQLKLVLDRLNKAVTNKSKSKPMYMVKREIDATQDGEHYHIAYVIDQYRVKSPYDLLDKALKRCVENTLELKLVKDYSIRKANLNAVWQEKEEVNSLPLLQYKEKALYWLAYLCKVRSTIEGQKCCWLAGTNNRRVIKRQTLAPIPVISACDSVSAPDWF